MSRRSEPQYKADDRRFPVRMRVAIPPGGFGARLDDMHAWPTARRGRDGYGMWSEAGRGYPDAMLVYLADLETAAAFVAAFGLELVPDPDETEAPASWRRAGRRQAAHGAVGIGGAGRALAGCGGGGYW